MAAPAYFSLAQNSAKIAEEGDLAPVCPIRVEWQGLLGKRKVNGVAALLRTNRAQQQSAGRLQK